MMDLDGACLLRTPLPRLREALADPAFVPGLLSEVESLSPRADGGHDFILQRRIAGAPLRLKGQARLVPLPDPDRWHLEAAVTAPLAGTVRLSLALDLTEEREGGAWLAHRGTLTAAGVLSRIMQARKDQIENRLMDEFRKIDRVVRRMGTRPGV